MNFEIFFWVFSKNSSDRGGESSGSLFFSKKGEGTWAKERGSRSAKWRSKSGLFSGFRKARFREKIGRKKFLVKWSRRDADDVSASDFVVGGRKKNFSKL